MQIYRSKRPNAYYTAVRTSLVAGLVFVFLFFSILPLLAQSSEKGQSEGFSNRNVSRPLISTDLEIVNESSRIVNGLAGQVIPIAFRINSKSSEMVEYDETIKLPEGWQIEVLSGPFQLAARTSQSRLVSFRCPQSTPEGIYRVEYVVTSRQNPERQSSNYCLVSIARPPAAEKSSTVAVDKAVAIKQDLSDQQKSGSGSAPQWFVPNPTQLKKTLRCRKQLKLSQLKSR